MCLFPSEDYRGLGFEGLWSMELYVWTMELKNTTKENQFKYFEVLRDFQMLPWLQLIYNTIVSILAEGLTCKYQSKTEMTKGL